MPVITAAEAPVFELAGAVFTGLAAPSRGAVDNAVCRVRVTSTDPGAEHTLDREEVLVALSGRAVATLAGVDHLVEAGDAIVVPAGVPFALRRATTASEQDGVGFEAMAVLPVGGRARFVGGEPFTPPWAE